MVKTIPTSPIFCHPEGPSVHVEFTCSPSGVTGIALKPRKKRGITWRIFPFLWGDRIEWWMKGYVEKRDAEPPPLIFPALPPFTKRVLTALEALPFGRAVSYRELAERAGSPKACRAAGAACGRNPFPLLIPCHRVVSARGLGGFSQGLAVKKQLLSFESS